MSKLYSISAKWGEQERARSLAWSERSADNREVRSSNLRGPINNLFFLKKKLDQKCFAEMKSFYQGKR